MHRPLPYGPELGDTGGGHGSVGRISPVAMPAITESDPQHIDSEVSKTRVMRPASFVLTESTRSVPQ